MQSLKQNPSYFMKRILFIIGLLICLGVLISCGALIPQQPPLPPLPPANTIPGNNETLITVRRESAFVGSAATYRIFANGQEMVRIANGGLEQFVVRNGNVNMEIVNPFDSAAKNNITFQAKGENLTFLLKPVMGGIEIKPESGITIAQNTNQTTSQRSSSQGVEGALEAAADEFSANLSKGSGIAIIEVVADDKNVRDFIIGELEYILSGKGFKIIDRAQLDKIRAEQKFGMTGEVDDQSAARIGQLAGANTIVTGRVDGAGELRRLRLRALDVNSGQVVGTASQRF